MSSTSKWQDCATSGSRALWRGRRILGIKAQQQKVVLLKIKYTIQKQPSEYCITVLYYKLCARTIRYLRIHKNNAVHLFNCVNYSALSNYIILYSTVYSILYEYNRQYIQYSPCTVLRIFLLQKCDGKAVHLLYTVQCTVYMYIIFSKQKI